LEVTARVTALKQLSRVSCSAQQRHAGICKSFSASLNNAEDVLSQQNMQSNDAFRHAEKDQEVEIQALESSMSAMKQVLDDVLDLQRMDSGKFTLKHEPFPFHTIVQAS
jgi:signal transduction histidine kinase